MSFIPLQKKINPRQGRSYYWFKGGAIHNAEYGTAGELLHNNFLKYYHSNQLAEAGTFKNGLKEGYWKTWYENGVLQSETYWNGGQKDGSYYSYDQAGLLVEKGRYKNNAKNGRWINYIAKDTLKYHAGKVVVKKQANTAKDTLVTAQKKPGFLKKLFTKKDKTATTDTPGKKAGKDVKANTAPEKKRPFYKRIFKKKDTAISSKAESKQPANKAEKPTPAPVKKPKK